MAELWDFLRLFPAHAGVIRAEEPQTVEEGTFPRTRGGDPIGRADELLRKIFSPHTRG